MQAQSTIRSETAPEPLAPLLALTTAVQAMATFSVFALPTLAPKAAATFALAPQDVGYQVSIIYIAATCMSGYAGLLVRRFGAGLISIAALGLCAIGLLGLSTGHRPIAIAASLLIGAGYGMTNPAASHLLLRYGPTARRNLIFAIKQAGVPIGAMLAAGLLPRFSEAIGWQGALMLSITLLALVAIPLLLRRGRWDDDRCSTIALRNGVSGGMTLILGHPILRALAFTGFCYAGFQVCLIAFTVTMLATEMKWSLVEAGLIAAVMQAAGMTGRITWSLFADRFRNGLMILVGLGLASFAFAVIASRMTAQWPDWAMILVLAAFGSCLIGWNGIYMAETARASGTRDVGLATGGVLMFNFAGVIVMPALFGIVANATGSIAVTFGVFAILPLVGAITLLAAVRVNSGAA
jgi:fucose permease